MIRRPSRRRSTAPSPRTASETRGSRPRRRAGAQSGRVELHELEVASARRPAAQREGQAVAVDAGGLVVVRRPGRDRRSPARPPARTTTLAPAVGRATTAPATWSRRPDPWSAPTAAPSTRHAGRRRAEERAVHLGAGGVAAGVDDPGAGGARPRGPAPAGRRRSRSRRAPEREQPGDGSAAPPRPGRERLRGRTPRARGRGVGGVVDRVVAGSTTAAMPPWAQGGAARRRRSTRSSTRRTPAEGPRDGSSTGAAAPSDEDVGLELATGRLTRHRRGVPMAIIRSTARRARAATSGSTVHLVPALAQARSSSSGVVIFMNRHEACGFIGRNVVRSLTWRSWCSMPISVATSAVPARMSRAASTMPPVERIAGALGRQLALAGQPDRRGRAAALGVHEHLRRRVAPRPAPAGRAGRMPACTWHSPIHTWMLRGRSPGARARRGTGRAGTAPAVRRGSTPTTSTALDDVQQTSDSAFTSAVVLT